MCRFEGWVEEEAERRGGGVKSVKSRDFRMLCCCCVCVDGSVQGHLLRR